MSHAGPVEVRMASHTDLDVLVNFSAAMAMETEGRGLDHDRLRRGILAVLKSTAHGFYLVSERLDAGSPTVVGQLLVTYEWSDWRCADFWWIQSVYVDPTWRRQGIYSQMHQHVVHAAQGRQDVCGIRLYVEGDNSVAQTAYRRLGLTESRYRMYETDFMYGQTSEDA